MNDPNAPTRRAHTLDPKIQKDWEDVQARRAEISTRDGGDSRRRAILERLGRLRQAS